MNGNIIRLLTKLMRETADKLDAGTCELTDDEAFWRGCEGCVNYPVLKERNRKFCICTAMLFDPEEHLPVKIPEDVLERIRQIDGA